MRGRAEERVRSLPLRVRARRLSMASSPSKARAPCSSAAKVGSRPSCFSHSGCAVPQGPPPSTWRARSGRASCESATPRRSRRRGSCSHPGILYLFPKRAKTSVRIRKRDHRRSRILCWASSPPEGHAYPGIVVSCTALRPHTALHAVAPPLCRSLRGPPRQRGRLPAGPTGGPACPAYILYLTCRLPKVDLSVTEVVYTTKVVYLPVLINPGSQFDS